MFSQLAGLLLLVVSIGLVEAVPAIAKTRTLTSYPGSKLSFYRFAMPINRTLLSEKSENPVLLRDTRKSFSPKTQELRKERVETFVAGKSTVGPHVGSRVDEDKARTSFRTRQTAPGSIRARSKSGAFPWAGLNPQGTYPWTRSILCMAICERNTYHMRDILKGKGRWQACLLKCKSDGSMTDVVGEIYEASFKEDFAPLAYYKGYLDYVSGKTGVVEQKMEWRAAY
ncbi:hypothetical protein CLIM01_09938 [Colletotrichum limetticola]|uniref:Uncharacterized protein n=1 Tax=Colletotrichum limetticola TaxID=1209924 RepID=A0ABQ9PMG3_9PEZI|nr:hypothetical protein CLIM01_09938 [Colletotrichum limetticola]